MVGPQRVGACAVLVWLEESLDSFQVVSLGQGPQTLAGWAAEGWRLGGLGVVQRAVRFPPGGVYEARAKGLRLGSSGIVLEVLGVGSGGVSEARPRSPRMFCLHYTILWAYSDFTGSARPLRDESV